MADSTVIEALATGGIVAPDTVVEEAGRAGLRLPLACALLEKESGGGRNVFGHDPTIFAGAGEVTQEKYEEWQAAISSAG